MTSGHLGNYTTLTDATFLYLGLTPSAYDSGSVTRCQGITKAGNSWARRILIEISWLWLRYKPQTAEL